MTMGFALRSCGSAAGLVCLTMACSGDGPAAALPEPPVVAGPPAALLITAGQDQAIIVGKELPTILEVKVVDAQQRPVKGQVVNFRVVSGGGSVFAGVAITSDSGIAKERWTIGTVVRDSQRVEARAVDVTGAAQVFGVFRAVALPDVPVAVRKVAGDSQVVVAGSAAAESLSVAVVDRYGNPIPRLTVRWAVTAGGGRVSADSSVSNDAGLAKVSWTVGQVADGQFVGPNPNRVTAQHGTFSLVTFSAKWVRAGDPSVLRFYQQAAGAVSGNTFVTEPIVRIDDTFGNHIESGNPVVTIAVSAGATLLGSATTYAGSGFAGFSNRGLVGPPGDCTLTYSTPCCASISQTIALTAPTVPAGPAVRLAIRTEPGGAVSGSAFTRQPVVELRDERDNLATNAISVVTASISNGTGTLVGIQSVTAQAGVATFTNLRIDSVGAYTLSFSSPPLQSVRSQWFIVALPSELSQLTATTATPGAAGSRPHVAQPVVKVGDPAGNLTNSGFMPRTHRVSTTPARR